MLSVKCLPSGLPNPVRRRDRHVLAVVAWHVRRSVMQLYEPCVMVVFGFVMQCKEAR
jgi:hypothetical protein